MTWSDFPHLSVRDWSTQALRLRWTCSVALTIGAVMASVNSTAFGEDVILVGRSAAGQIEVQVGFLQPLTLPVSVFPGISGFATGELGLHSTILDEPTNDFFQFSSAADFRFILLAKDPGMEVWNDTGSGFMGIGDSFYIGPAPFDTHPVWNLLTGTPGNSYSLTLKIRDLNGIYADSAAVVLSFTPPAPLLTIISTGTNNIIVSWPLPADGWVLEQASSPGASAALWTEITGPYQTNATQSWITVSSPSGNSYYRLHKL